MSATTHLRTTATGRRALLAAGVLAALIAAAGVGAAPANALVPLDGFRANVILTSSTFAFQDAIDSLEALPIPQSHLAPIAKNLAEGTLEG